MFNDPTLTDKDIVPSQYSTVPANPVTDTLLGTISFSLLPINCKIAMGTIWAVAPLSIYTLFTDFPSSFTLMYSGLLWSLSIPLRTNNAFIIVPISPSNSDLSTGGDLEIEATEILFSIPSVCVANIWFAPNS